MEGESITFGVVPGTEECSQVSPSQAFRSKRAYGRGLGLRSRSGTGLGLGSGVGMKYSFAIFGCRGILDETNHSDDDDDDDDHGNDSET